MRIVYTAVWWLALPLVLARLWWRGRREPGYRQHVAERLGIYSETSFAQGKPVIWIHAVSVGETRAAEPLVDALLQTYPDIVILLTHMTPTGRSTGNALFAAYAPRVIQCYVPYDIGWMVSRFLDYFAPRLCVLMETEVWPNAVARCVRHRVPVALVNARLSARSLAKGKRMSTLIAEAAEALDCVAAQTAADARRLQELGARNVHVTGSIKFDVTPPASALAAGLSLRRQFGNRPALLCASTRDGEETLILDCLDSMDVGNLLVVIVPRHPQRFSDVARLIAGRGIVMARRSTLGELTVAPNVQVLLGDSMGEMFLYYAACDIAFIGGSLLPLGGQNMIEACAVGKPVLLGPHTFNFDLISEEAIAAGAALRVADAANLLRETMRLLRADAKRTNMGVKAGVFAEQHRGAAQRTMALLETFLRLPQASQTLD